MIYCKECLYNNFKPDLIFNEERICSACLAYKARKNINWLQREKEFVELVKFTKEITRNKQYDCIIPVSGGKDSYSQTIKALEYGLRPLLVNARTCHLSELGRSNLDGLSLLGCDILEVAPDMALRKRINRYTLETIGDISWPEHVLIFTVPVQIAIEKNIPLIIWGENPQAEYGGPKEWQEKNELVPNRWLSEFGGLNGLRVSDVSEGLGIPIEQFVSYMYPSTKSLSLKQVYLGYYFPWDGLSNAKIACEHGFETSLDPVETSGFDYENLDNYQTGIHDYFKYIKYGFGRATDMCSTAIRHGRITREQAIEHVNQWDGLPPLTYLGKHVDEILEPLGLDMLNLVEVANKFANKELFETSFYNWPRQKFTVE